MLQYPILWLTSHLPVVTPFAHFFPAPPDTPLPIPPHTLYYVPLFLLSPCRPVGPSTRCSSMRRPTLGARPMRPQRTVPRSWRSSAGGRSTPVRSTMAGGFSMSTPTTADASTSWRRANTANLATGGLSVLQSSPSGALPNDLPSIQNIKDLL